MTIKETIKMLRELESECVKNNWQIFKGLSVKVVSGEPPKHTPICIMDKDERILDAQLICETRNALPELLEYISNLEAVSEAAKKFIFTYDCKHKSSGEGYSDYLLCPECGDEFEDAFKKLEGTNGK